MKKIAVSYYSTWIELALNSIRSFKYFNSDYDIAIVKLNSGHVAVERPCFCTGLFLQGYDKVICLGADTFTISECKELDDNNFDILGSMSIHNSNSGCQLILPRNRNLNSTFTTDNYINADVICCNNINFMIDFWYLNYKDELKQGYWDQDYLCWLFNSELYTHKILDKELVCYNESGRRQWLNGQFGINNNKVILNDKRELKILRWAGEIMNVDKSKYHINNWYLNNLPNGLNNICIDIYNKSKNIKVPIFKPNYNKIENYIKDNYL